MSKKLVTPYKLVKEFIERIQKIEIENMDEVIEYILKENKDSIYYINKSESEQIQIIKKIISNKEIFNISNIKLSTAQITKNIDYIFNSTIFCNQQKYSNGVFLLNIAHDCINFELRGYKNLFDIIKYKIDEVINNLLNEFNTISDKQLFKIFINTIKDSQLILYSTSGSEVTDPFININIYNYPININNKNELIINYLYLTNIDKYDNEMIEEFKSKLRNLDLNKINILSITSVYTLIIKKLDNILTLGNSQYAIFPIVNTIFEYICNYIMNNNRLDIYGYSIYKLDRYIYIKKSNNDNIVDMIDFNNRNFEFKFMNIEMMNIVISSVLDVIYDIYEDYKDVGEVTINDLVVKVIK